MEKTLTLDTPVAETTQEGFPGDQSQLPIWDKIQRRMQAIPAEELAQLPSDGAAEHDHYLYGMPKRQGS